MNFNVEEYRHLLDEQAKKDDMIVFSIVFDESGEFMFAGTNMGSIYVLDLKPLMTESFWNQKNIQKKPKANFVFKAHETSIYSLLIEKNVLISAGDDGTIRFFDINVILEKMNHHSSTQNENEMAVDSNVNQSKSNSKSKNLKIDTSITPTKQIALPTPALDGMLPEINDIAIDKNQNLFAGCGDNIIYAWDINNLNEKPILKLKEHSSYIHQICVGDENELISASEDASIKIWDIRESKSIKTLMLPESNSKSKQPTTSSAYLSSLSISNDKQWIAAGGGLGAIGLWHKASQKLIKILPQGSAIGTLKFLSKNVSAQRNESSIISGGDGDGLIYHWKFDGVLLQKSKTIASSIFALNVNQSDQYHLLASGGTSKEIALSYGNFSSSAITIQL